MEEKGEEAGGKRKLNEDITGRVGSNDPDTCNWFDPPSNNFSVTDDLEQFLFGKGEFKYIQWDLRVLPEGSSSYEPPTHRNAVFLVNPDNNEIIFFKTMQHDIWRSDSADEGSKFKTKARDVLNQLKSFGIMPQKPFFVSMDTPLHTSLNEYHNWHQDYFPMFFMPQDFQTKINNAFNKNTRSDYTMIQYTSNCTSTAVKIPGTDCDYARFLANPGTVVCVNNTELVHASPIIDEPFFGVSRIPGNKRLRPIFTSDCPNIHRPLYRTQIKRVEQQAVNAIRSDATDKFTLVLSDVLNEILVPFEEFTLSQYLNYERHNKEAGGARKRKTMCKIAKTRKKTKRTKRTKSKTRKR